MKKECRPGLCAVAVLLLAAAASAAEPTGEVEAILPKAMNVKVVVKLAELPVSAASKDVGFDVDGAGRVFLLVGDRLIRLRQTADEPGGVLPIPGVKSVDDFAFMGDGTLLMISGRDLGELTTKGFTKIQRLPAAGMRLVRASADTCYLFGGTGALQNRDVYLFRKDGKLLRLLSAPSPVNAVAGTGELTFFAVGRFVYFHAPQKPLRLIHTAEGEVTSLAVAPSGRLFVSTASGVGTVSGPGRAFTFLRGEGARLCVRGDVLTLFSPSRGVITISPVSLFEQMAEDLATKMPPGSRLDAKALAALEAGLAAAKTKNWEAAITHFEAARKRAPYSPEVLYNLALANDNAGGRELPASCWYRAYLAAAPEAADARAVRSRMTQLEKRCLDNARKMIREAQTLNARTVKDDKPVYVDSRRLTVVRAQTALGDFAAARANIGRIKDSIDKDLAYRRLATDLARSGNTSEAMSTTRSIFRRPTRVEALCWIAEETAKTDPAASRRALDAAEYLVRTTDRKDSKNHMLTTVRKTKGTIAAGGEDKSAPAEAVVRMITRGETTHAEITDWSNRARQCAGQKELGDVTAFLGTLEGKTPAGASSALAEAAESIGKTRQTLRRREACWKNSPPN